MKYPRKTFLYQVWKGLLQKSSSAKSRFLETLYNNQFVRNKLYSVHGKNLAQLGPDSFYYDATLSTQDVLESVFSLFNLYQKELNNFDLLRKQYENERLLKDYDAASHTLSFIDKTIGVSMWSCGQRMLLKELGMGLEANKRELAQLSQTLPPNYITLFLLMYYSCIAETNLSYANYKIDLLKKIKKIGNTTIEKYLMNKLILDLPYAEWDIPLLLQLDMQYSIIDLFISTEKILPIYYKDAICSGKLDINYIPTKSICSNLFHNFSLINPDVSPKMQEMVELNKDMYTILDAYTIGNYSDAVVRAKEYLNKNPRDFQIATILCKSLLNAGLTYPNDVKISYIKSIYSVYSMDDSCREAVLALQREMKYSYASILSTKIRAFLFRKQMIDGDEDLVFVSSILDEALHPNFARYLDPQVRVSLFEVLNAVCPFYVGLVSAELTRDFSTDILKNVDGKRMLFSQAKIACNFGDSHVAPKYLMMLESLCEPCNLYEKERISRIKLSLYKNEKNYLAAIHLLVDVFFENTFLFERLSVCKYFELPRKMRDISVLKDVYYIILLYLLDGHSCSRQIVAYNNLLELNGYESILDALSILNDNSNNIWDFFFFKVCTVNLIKRDSTLFKKGIPPESARIKILQKLHAIRPSKQYLAEINDILTTEALRDKLNTINKSRIHVDVDKIYYKNKFLWEEIYQKYLISRGFKQEIQNANIDDLVVNQRDNQLKCEITTIPKIQQHTVVLRSLIEQIVEECLFSTQYGLETYLSSRIRHGYCKGQLINFLSELHLICMRNETSQNIYSLNKYWDDQVKEKSNSYLAIIAELSRFTETIENKIEEVRTKWLRIKYKNTSEGMFNYPDFSDIASLFVFFPVEAEFSDFLKFYKYIVERFWQATDINLKAIRERIGNELMQFYIDTIDDLEKHLKEITDDYITYQIKQDILKNCNMAKSGVVTVIKQFREVFSRNAANYVDFTMKELTDSCRKVLEKQYSKNDRTLWEIDADCSYVFNGKYFTSFVDVLCILLNNSLTHSGVDKEKGVSICIKIKEMEDNADDFIQTISSFSGPHKYPFCMSVTNTLGSHINPCILKDRIQEVFDEVKKEQDNRQLIQREGGSGLYKLCKTIAYNIEAPYWITYDIQPGAISLQYWFMADTLLCKEEIDENSIN